MSFLKAVDNKNRKLFLAIGIAVLAAILFIGGWIFISKSGFFYKKVDTGSQKFSLVRKCTTSQGRVICSVAT